MLDSKQKQKHITPNPSLPHFCLPTKRRNNIFKKKFPFCPFLSVLVTVLLSALVKRFSIYRVRNFFFFCLVSAFLHCDICNKKYKSKHDQNCSNNHIDFYLIWCICHWKYNLCESAITFRRSSSSSKISSCATHRVIFLLLTTTMESQLLYLDSIIGESPILCAK